MERSCGAARTIISLLNSSAPSIWPRGSSEEGAENRPTPRVLVRFSWPRNHQALAEDTRWL